MIDTSKAKTVSQTSRNNVVGSHKYQVASRPISLYLAWLQIGLGLVTGAIFIQGEQRSGKESWIVFTAIIPIAAIMVLSPFMIVAAGLFFARNREATSSHKVVITIALLISLFALFFVGVSGI